MAGAGLGAGRGWCSCPAGDQGQQQGGEKWSDSRYIVKVQPKGFTSGSGIEGGRRGAKGTPRSLAQGIGRMEFVFTGMGGQRRGRCGGGNQELRLLLRCPQSAEWGPVSRWASSSGGRERSRPGTVSAPLFWACVVPSHPPVGQAVPGCQMGLLRTGARWQIDLSSPMTSHCSGLEAKRLAWPVSPASFPFSLLALVHTMGLCTCSAGFWSVPYLLGGPGCDSSFFWASVSLSVKGGAWTS